jgi:magnesium-transporting ATPase (P-type)
MTEEMEKITNSTTKAEWEKLTNSIKHATECTQDSANFFKSIQTAINETKDYDALKLFEQYLIEQNKCVNDAKFLFQIYYFSIIWVIIVLLYSTSFVNNASQDDDSECYQSSLKHNIYFRILMVINLMLYIYSIYRIFSTICKSKKLFIGLLFLNLIINSICLYLGFSILKCKYFKGLSEVHIIISTILFCSSIIGTISLYYKK